MSNNISSAGLDHPIMEAVSNIPAVIWFLAGLVLLAVAITVHMGLLVGAEVFAAGLLTIGVGKSFARLWQC